MYNVTTFVNKYFLLLEIKFLNVFRNYNILGQIYEIIPREASPRVLQKYAIRESLYFFDSPAMLLDPQLSCRKLKAFVENNRNCWD